MVHLCILLSVLLWHDSSALALTPLQQQRQQQKLRRQQQSGPLGKHRSITATSPSRALSAAPLRMAYVPPEQSNTLQPQESSQGSSSKPLVKQLHPKVGDFVRFFDVDGGKADGEVLVGKITFIQTNQQKKNTDSSSSANDRWSVDLVALEDVGDGFYAEPSNSRRGRRETVRNLNQVSPVRASFVRTENAYRIPFNKETGRPAVIQETYDLETYEGPTSSNSMRDSTVDWTIVEEDGIKYAAIKARLLRTTALVGAVGAIITQFAFGSEEASLYAVGVVASLAYLQLLTLKTDTIASTNNKLGSSVSNLRFFMPALFIILIAAYNKTRGDDNPVLESGIFQSITTTQFGSFTAGFLSYRVPLFVLQLADAFKDTDSDASTSGTVPPGSAGVAMKLLQSQQEASQSGAKNVATATGSTATIPTILLVSGPQATRRSELVQKLLQESKASTPASALAGEDEESTSNTGTPGSDLSFIVPTPLDKVKDPIAFERLEQRGEFLTIDSSGRYGLTKQIILEAAQQAQAQNKNKSSSPSVVIVDANVEIAKALAAQSGLRLVGVWVGLTSVKAFEDRLASDIAKGIIPIPEMDDSVDDEDKKPITAETIIRARIKDIVKEIEYGITSGLFEFTILLDESSSSSDEDAIAQLRKAARYASKE